MTKMIGHYWDDFFDGGDGYDQIYGKGGDDVLHGWGGNDHVFGDSGADNVFGDAGDDRVGGGSGDDFIWDPEGNNILDGGRGDDWVEGTGWLRGRQGDDYVVADHTARLEGGSGHDTFQVTMNAAEGAIYNYDGGLAGLGAAQKIIVEDFHPGSDRLSLYAVDPLGNSFGEGDWLPSVISAFDSNQDNVLTKDDTYVDATPDGKGIDLHFWNIELELTNIQSLSQDFLI